MSWVKCPKCGSRAIQDEDGINCIKCMKTYPLKEAEG